MQQIWTINYRNRKSAKKKILKKSVQKLDIDPKYCIYFEEIAERILKNVPEQNKKNVKKQLDQLEKTLWITYITGMGSIIEMDL